jgi:hypothetical protein
MTGMDRPGGTSISRRPIPAPVLLFGFRISFLVNG